MLEHIIKTHNGATDIHLTEGGASFVREGGALTAIEGGGDILASLAAGLPAAKKRELAETGSADSAVTAGGHRCRVHLYRADGRLCGAVRILKALSALPADADEAWLTWAAGLRSGLLIVSGATGSGKTTTLARIVSEIAQRRAAHIVTIEDPVEYLFSSTRSLIHRREVGEDVPDFASGVRDALREDPDVILIGEMRDAETIKAALTAAETGRLVLATMHNRTAADAVGRIVHAFPGDKENEVRPLIASVLQSIAAQALCRNGEKTILLRELLVNTPAISHLIREGKDSQIAGYMEMGTRGMRTMRQNAERTARAEGWSTDERERVRQFLENY